MSEDSSRARLHPIGVVARRTGLKPDLIRAWERRYGAVVPTRSQTRRRFYTDQDIERLRLLRKAVDGGRSIGQVADLPEIELQQLIADDEPERVSVTTSKSPAPLQTAEEFLEACMQAIRNLDARELSMQCEKASLSLSRTHLLESLMVPLMQRVGEEWRAGTLRPVHEHLAAATVRTYVGTMPGAFLGSASAPRLLVTTPAGQLHELGALFAAASAAIEGWNVTYLGPNLPAEEIAAGALQRQARGVALSLTFPPDDPQLANELVRLQRLLPKDVNLLAGGRSVASYASTLQHIGAQVLDELSALKSALETLRVG